MVDFLETDDTRAVLRQKLRQQFEGRIVRKDLTKKIKEGANVPVYVLEFLLGQYCGSDDTETIELGVESVKRILTDNFVRPDEAQKILSLLRQRGSHTVIDKITVSLNIKKDCYEAEFSNLGLKAVPIDESYPAQYDRLLCGGIWCIVQLDYEYVEEDRNGSRISRTISTTTKDYIINYQDLQGIGMTGKLALSTLIALCSIALGKPTIISLAVMGEISISGTMMRVDELANSLQVCLDSGAKKVLLPITSAADLGTVPPELIGCFNLIFYNSAEDAVYKALGVE